jgi:hypothetical protein
MYVNIYTHTYILHSKNEAVTFIGRNKIKEKRMEAKERCAKGHQSNTENSFRSKKVGSYLTVFNMKQLH